MNGQFVGIEVKRPKQHVTQLQKFQLHNIREAGGIGIVVRDAKGLKRALDRSRPMDTLQYCPECEGSLRDGGCEDCY
jgi:hypothetical protein